MKYQFEKNSNLFPKMYYKIIAKTARTNLRDLLVIESFVFNTNLVTKLYSLSLKPRYYRIVATLDIENFQFEVKLEI